MKWVAASIVLAGAVVAGAVLYVSDDSRRTPSRSEPEPVAVEEPIETTFVTGRLIRPLPDYPDRASRWYCRDFRDAEIDATSATGMTLDVYEAISPPRQELVDSEFDITRDEWACVSHFEVEVQVAPVVDILVRFPGWTTRPVRHTLHGQEIYGADLAFRP